MSSLQSAEEAASGFRRGRCKWFNVAKGWGFITPEDDPEQEVFVHQSVVQKSGFRSLGDDEVVEFTAELRSKGLEATHVRAVGGGDVQGSHRRPGAKRKAKKPRCCFNCGDFGDHLAKDCPHESLPKRCYNCKSTEHLIGECPQPTTTTRAEQRRKKKEGEKTT